MANHTINIPAGGGASDQHCRRGDQIQWASTTGAWNLGFNNSPFVQTGGPQTVPVPNNGNSGFLVVVGAPNTYPYTPSLASGGGGADPSIIVDPPPGG